MAVLHNSDIAQFKRCRQLWDFTSPLRRNLEPERPIEPLEFGTLWHKVLELHYTGSAPDAIHAVIDQEINAWAEKVGDDPEDEEMLEEYRILAHRMFDTYIDWAPTVDDFEVVWVERAYEIPVDDFTYGFKADGLVRTSDGKVWLMEHKSASKLPGDNIDYLLTDDQVGRYLWGLHEAEGIEIEGVIYNIARKVYPQPLKVLKSGHFSTDKRQTTTYAMARKQIEEKYDSIPPSYKEFLTELQSRGYSNFFYRAKVRRNKTEIENIGVSFRLEAMDMLNDPSIYRTPSAFNCNGCAFLGPCLSKWEGGDFETILSGNYQTRKD